VVQVEEAAQELLEHQEQEDLEQDVEQEDQEEQDYQVVFQEHQLHMRVVVEDRIIMHLQLIKDLEDQAVEEQQHQEMQHLEHLIQVVAVVDLEIFQGQVLEAQAVQESLS
jgi:ABC-type lipoprotein export system ATPase subunit